MGKSFNFVQLAREGRKLADGSRVSGQSAYLYLINTATFAIPFYDGVLENYKALVAQGRGWEMAKGKPAYKKTADVLRLVLKHTFQGSLVKEDLEGLVDSLMEYYCEACQVESESESREVAEFER